MSGGGSGHGKRKNHAATRAAVLQLTQMLTEMGFTKSHVEDGLKQVNVLDEFALDHCIQWMTDNAAVDPSEFRAAHAKEVEALSKMGFSTEEAIEGLRHQESGGIHRAVMYVLIQKTLKLKRQIRDARVSLAHLGEPLPAYDEEKGVEMLHIPAPVDNADADKKVCKKRIMLLQHVVLSQQQTYISLKMMLEDVGGPAPPQFEHHFSEMPPPPPDDDDDGDEYDDDDDDDDDDRPPPPAAPLSWRAGRRGSNAPPPPPTLPPSLDDMNDDDDYNDDEYNDSPSVSPTSFLGFHPPPPSTDDAMVILPTNISAHGPTTAKAGGKARLRLRRRSSAAPPPPPPKAPVGATGLLQVNIGDTNVLTATDQQVRQARRSMSSLSSLSPRAEVQHHRKKQHSIDETAKTVLGRSRILSLLGAKKDESGDGDGGGGSGGGGGALQAYTSVQLEIVDVLELAAKLGKTFVVLAGCGITRFKSGVMQSSALKEAWTPMSFEFNLTPLSTDVMLRIFDSDEKAYVGEVKLALSALNVPSYTEWHSMKTVRVSSFAKLRSRAQKTTDVHLRVRFREARANPPDPSYTLVKTTASKSDTSAIGDALRSRASGNTVRFQDDGFDLDLTYITSSMIAMGFPALGAEAVYRNRMKDVQRFLNLYHHEHYRVYNLCADKKYAAAKFAQNVVEIDIAQHAPPSFADILHFCRDADKWLNAHPKNVVAVHGLSGRHRTGCMIACLLLYRGVHNRSSKAIQHFNDKRTVDGQGLCLPAQMRYVRYWGRYVTGKMGVHNDRDLIDDPLLTTIRAKTPPTLMLHRVTLSNVPKVASGSTIWFNITMPSVQGYKFSSRKTVPAKPVTPNSLMWYVPPHVPVAVKDDVRVDFFYGTTFRKKELMMFAFNTRFIPVLRVMSDAPPPTMTTTTAAAQVELKYRIKLPKWGIDRAANDVQNSVYPEDMWIELTFNRGSD